jgi:hypothetical protein
MVRPVPPSDFRALRHKLDPDDFALSDGPDPPASDLVDEKVWAGITHLPDDVAIRTSDHNGVRLTLLYSLWGDWITATGDGTEPDELFAAMLDALDAFQCATFLYLHGYYRAAMSELRVALEQVIMGTFGNLWPTDPDYVKLRDGNPEVPLTRLRKRMESKLTKAQCKWLFGDGEFLQTTFRGLSDFTHSRPQSSDATLWESNGPVYAQDAAMRVFKATVAVYAICYLLVRIGRPDFALPPDSRILFEEEWVPGRQAIATAFEQLYGESASAGDAH